MKSLVWQQNRHQKVCGGFYICGSGDFTFVHWGLTFWNFNKHHCFIQWFKFQFGETWSFVSEGLSPPKAQRDCVTKPLLAFSCNWFWKVLRLRDISSLHEMSSFLFISMTGPKVAQRIQVVSILLHEAKPVLGLIFLHLNTIGWSGHVTSTLHRGNWLGFKSLWLGFGIRAYGQALGSTFAFSGSVFRIRV